MFICVFVCKYMFTGLTHPPMPPPSRFLHYPQMEQVVSDTLWEDNNRYVKSHLRVRGTSSQFYEPKDQPRQSTEIWQKSQDLIKALAGQGPPAALVIWE